MAIERLEISIPSFVERPGITPLGDDPKCAALLPCAAQGVVQQASHCSMFVSSVIRDEGTFPSAFTLGNDPNWFRITGLYLN